MNVAGLIFSNIHDQSIPEMARMRTMASIPFGCRYRLIDFALSNMVNADINTVGVITHYNYQSLLDHIGTGKDWDLARRSGGIKILPPYVAAYENTAAGKLYSSRLEALMGAEHFINRCGADYMVLSDCDVVMNLDLGAVLADHVKSGAYLTMVTKHVNADTFRFDKAVNLAQIGKDDRVRGVSRAKPESGEADVNTNIYVIKRTDLQSIDSLAHGYTSFSRDIIRQNLDKKLIRAYRYDGWYAYIGTLESYFRTSMELLTPDARRGLFGAADRKIYTKIRNSAPTKYCEGAEVKNSLVANGCVIEGSVENCVLFRGVHVGRGAHLKDCIIMQDCYIEEEVEMENVILDKVVTVRAHGRLIGQRQYPIVIGKNVTL